MASLGSDLLATHRARVRSVRVTYIFIVCNQYEHVRMKHVCGVMYNAI